MGKTKDVRAAVEAELGFDPLVDSSDIKVMNIGGDVTLVGTVPSYPQYLEAAAAARRVDGVINVHNSLMVVLPDSDYRLTGASRPPALMPEPWRQRQPPQPRRAATRYPSAMHIRLVSNAPRQAKRPAS